MAEKESVSVERTGFTSTQPSPCRAEAHPSSGWIPMLTRRYCCLPAILSAFPILVVEEEGSSDGVTDGGCPMTPTLPTLVTVGSARERLMSSAAPSNGRRGEPKTGTASPCLR